jgi:succinate dehydrogenase / fumarate reductase flavoprotein subunit
MTKAATVIRHNDEMRTAYAKVCELQEQADHCSIADTSTWANQTAPFARALEDMFPVAKAILQGAIARDESRGSHFKPEFALGEIHAAEPAQCRREAEAWVDRFEANNRKWLKSTLATCGPDGEPTLNYEEVNTSLIPPRPRLYGLAGGDMIEQVYKERQAKKQ